MSSDSISPRIAVAVGMLALIPVAWYGVASSGTAGIFSAINVLIMIAALLIATSPVEDSTQHNGAAS